MKKVGEPQGKISGNSNFVDELGVDTGIQGDSYSLRIATFRYVPVYKFIRIAYILCILHCKKILYLSKYFLQ